ncbi:MAG TPA: VOC family protein [Gemmataceae bacterium]|nr:VOC family protein [Gemmataceae bacterium]
MSKGKLRLAGIELYFNELDAAKRFNQDTLGLTVRDEEPGHHVQFDGGAAFICLERKGVESYPSDDKAVVFFEVADLQATVEVVGRDRFVQLSEDASGHIAWAVLHDPEGDNVLLLQSK